MMSTQNILNVVEKDTKKMNLYDQVVTPTRVSDDMLFSLLASFTTESFDQILRTLNSVVEYSDRIEKTEKKQIVPTEDVDAQYKTALSKYQQGVLSNTTPSYVPREPRVSFFYHNDHESFENETTEKKSETTEKKSETTEKKSETTEKKSETTEKKSETMPSVEYWSPSSVLTSEKKGSSDSKKSKESKKNKRPHNPRDRRRVVSYVWVDVTPSNATTQERKGIVYYGGSVYNPTPTIRGVLKRLIEKRITTKEQLMNTIRTMKIEYSSPSNYNRAGEKQTAFGRLCQRPIVFETSASTHQQVREEIKRLMFSRGVFGKRASDDVDKKKKRD